MFIKEGICAFHILNDFNLYLLAAKNSLATRK
jgi:hypothetical protein